MFGLFVSMPAGSFYSIIATVLESFMLVACGFGWPIVAYKIHSAKTNTGTSVLHFWLTWVGYVCGIIGKILRGGDTQILASVFEGSMFFLSNVSLLFCIFAVLKAKKVDGKSQTFICLTAAGCAFGGVPSRILRNGYDWVLLMYIICVLLILYDLYLYRKYTTAIRAPKKPPIVGSSIFVVILFAIICGSQYTDVALIMYIVNIAVVGTTIKIWYTYNTG